MNPENHWEKEVEKTMDMLGQIGRVQPSDGFESGVIDRLREEGRQGFSWSIPAIAAGLVLLIGLNLFSLFSNQRNRGMDKTTAVSSFYQLDDSSDVYDQLLKR